MIILILLVPNRPEIFITIKILKRNCKKKKTRASVWRGNAWIVKLHIDIVHLVGYNKTVYNIMQGMNNNVKFCLVSYSWIVHSIAATWQSRALSLKHCCAVPERNFTHIACEKHRSNGTARDLKNALRFRGGKTYPDLMRIGPCIILIFE